MRGDTFTGQQPAGIRWLHVHPHYLVADDAWTIVRLAQGWREGILPESGGTANQSAMTTACVEVVLSTWNKMAEARRKKTEKD